MAAKLFKCHRWTDGRNLDPLVSLHLGGLGNNTTTKLIWINLFTWHLHLKQNFKLGHAIYKTQLHSIPTQEHFTQYFQFHLFHFQKNFVAFFIISQLSLWTHEFGIKVLISFQYLQNTATFPQFFLLNRGYSSIEIKILGSVGLNS